nr:hypothetical protein WG33_0058 [uncultured bacterium]
MLDAVLPIDAKMFLSTEMENWLKTMGCIITKRIVLQK